LGALAAGLFLSTLLSQVLIAQGIFQVDAAVPGNGNWFAHLRFPLPNALALYALNDDNQVGASFYWATVVAVVGVLIAGARKSLRAVESLVRRRVWFSLAVLLITTLAVCFIGERSSAYRAIFPLTGVVLVLFVHALRLLTVRSKVRLTHYAVLGLAGVVIAITANRSVQTLVADAQGREWELMQNTVVRASFTRPVRVHIVMPSDADRSTERVYGDEYGALSSGTDAMARDMFKAALHARYPDRLPSGGSYTLATGYDDPLTGTYDLLIDMRKLAGER
ncbi:MAG: hypothetical protein ABW223_13170, partial [Rariglobus sp.]